MRSTKDIKQEQLAFHKSKKNENYNEKDYTPHLQISPEQEELVQEKIADLKQENLPAIWEELYSTIHWIPVDDGEIRVLHIKPKKPVNVRPIVFISGWQTMLYQFEDMMKILHETVEFYLIETREKYTSKIDRKKGDFSLHQKAKDVKKVLQELDLIDKDYVLFGSCWGAAVICQGLIDGILDPPTPVIFSPMHKLWLSKFFKNWVVPYSPLFFIKLFLKVAPFFIFLGEKATTQKNRMLQTIREAEVWKWKKTTLDTRDFELFGKMHAIKQEVLVISGTHDKVHKANDYPRFADEMPNGRFFFFGINEAQRELVLGTLIYELSKVSKDQGIPDFFKEFEKRI